MFICETCLKPNDKHSIVPMSYGPCEICHETKECYEVYIHDKVAPNDAKPKAKPVITITIEGGVVQHVQIPKGAGVIVQIKDYDVQDWSDKEKEEAAINTDKDGDEYNLDTWSVESEE